MTTGQWYHVAVSRSGNSFRAFIDGVQIGSTVIYSGTAYIPTAGGISIGAAEPYISGGSFFDGYMQDLRITKGLARYTANFTPSATLLSGGYDTSKLPASPIAGQLAVSENNIYVCTNAIGPIWKRASLMSVE